MANKLVNALVDAAMSIGTNRDALGAKFEAVVRDHADDMKRQVADGLTLQGWTPPQRLSADDVAKHLPKGVTINPKVTSGELRSLGNGAVGLTGLDIATMSQADRARLDGIKYKFVAPEDQDALVLKPQYRAQYDNGTLFEI